jgi:integrase
MVEMPVPHKNLRRSHRLSDDEIRWMWKALDDSPPAYAALLRFLLLTAARRDEARLMVDSELSADGMTWVVPGSRAKNHLDHLVGLSRQAREQLALAREKRVNGKAGYLFTLDAEHPLCGMSKWKTRLDRKMLEIAREERGEDAKVEPWQIHDFRRCARSFLSRVTSPDVAERVLAHVVGGVRAHYDLHAYSSEKSKALALWAREVERIIAGKTATVLPIRRQRQANSIAVD